VLSRRSLLTGAAIVAGGGAAAVFGVAEGALPGRHRLRRALGLDGPDGVVPDNVAGPVVSGSFVSQRRGGATVGWSVAYPPGADADDPLPVVVALHGLGMTHESVMGAYLGVPHFLAAAVADGTPPFAVAAADGGTGYWHPHDGDDAGAMVTDELLPLLAARGLRVDRLGLIGWSMGGYGVLRLAGQLGSGGVAAVAAVSPALWVHAGDASSSGFDSAAEYEQYSVMHDQRDLAGIPLRVDIGDDDPFLGAVETYLAGFPAGAGVTSTVERGGHDPGYWTRMLPLELAFLGRALAGGEVGSQA
jgi:S-formylglutathione hydrolase FrmB